MHTAKPKESDWKHFSSLLDPLRERYLEEINAQLVRILTDPKKTPTDAFWDTDEELKRRARILRDCLDDCRRSNMWIQIGLMCRHCMMRQEDITGFSPELQQRINTFHFPE